MTETDLQNAVIGIRVTDHIGLHIKHMEELKSQIAEIKAHMTAMVAHAELPEAEIAEIYWRFEEIPVSALGPVREVQQIAVAHPHWSWRCVHCGAEVFITSRADKKRRESEAKEKSHLPYRWMCTSCRKSAATSRETSYREEENSRKLREHELRTMPYKKYLLTPEWQERRKAALGRAGYKCQVCNRSRTLHVHHRTYERRGMELARDLIVLCDQCHALYHGKGLLAPHPEEGLRALVPSRRLFPQPPEGPRGWERGSRPIRPLWHVLRTASHGRVHPRGHHAALRQQCTRGNARPREAGTPCARRLAHTRLPRLQPLGPAGGTRTSVEDGTAKALAGGKT